MQGSKKWGFVWWCVGDNAGRSVREFLKDAGCDDFYVYNEEGEIMMKGENPVIRTHNQGIPKGFEGYPIISNARNPYAQAASYFLDISLQDYIDTKVELGDIKKWITQLVDQNSGFYDLDFAYWNAWSKIGANPDYYIRVENLEEDIKNIPLIISNTTTEDLEESLNINIRYDNFNERDKWLEYPEMKWQREYDKDGKFMWQHFYDQELADTVYNSWGEAFILMGYDKDSWKQ